MSPLREELDDHLSPHNRYFTSDAFWTLRSVENHAKTRITTLEVLIGRKSKAYLN
jgi:hypothetical protein